MDPLIQLKGVVKNYHTPAGDFPALRGIDLEITAGEFVGVLGKSGSGKTTLVNMLTGVDHLTTGEIWIDGIPIHQLGENELAVWRGANVGVIYQSFHLLPTLTLLDNVLLPVDFSGQFQPLKSKGLALELLRQVELEEHAYKLPAAISGGQQQRVAIARALANDPTLLVADEPTGRLDTATAETIFQLFNQLVAQGRTIVMVTHDLSLAQRVERNIWLSDGQIVSEAEFAGL